MRARQYNPRFYSNKCKREYMNSIYFEPIVYAKKNIFNDPRLGRIALNELSL